MTYLHDELDYTWEKTVLWLISGCDREWPGGRGSVGGWSWGTCLSLYTHTIVAECGCALTAIAAIRSNYSNVCVTIVQVSMSLIMKSSWWMVVPYSSLTLGLHHPTRSSWSVHLTGCHVARIHLNMESGTFRMEVGLRTLLRDHQQHFTETEITMETLICIV